MLVPDVVPHGTYGKNMEVGSTVQDNILAVRPSVVVYASHPVPGPATKAPTCVNGHAYGGLTLCSRDGLTVALSVAVGCVLLGRVVGVLRGWINCGVVVLISALAPLAWNIILRRIIPVVTVSP